MFAFEDADLISTFCISEVKKARLDRKEKMVHRELLVKEDRRDCKDFKYV